MRFWVKGAREGLVIRAALSHHGALMDTAIGQVEAGRKGAKRRCADCFFHQHKLCALGLSEACPTFREAHPDGLRPPQQLSFVFRTQAREQVASGPARGGWEAGELAAASLPQAAT